MAREEASMVYYVYYKRGFFYRFLGYYVVGGTFLNKRLDYISALIKYKRLYFFRKEGRRKKYCGEARLA